MEKLELRSSSTRAKVLGTIFSISGAFVVTLYRGPRITLTPTTSSRLARQLPNATPSNWALGGLFLTAEYILVPMWYIIQVRKLAG